MSIIDQLEHTVTPAVLGRLDNKNSVAQISLLEQFYAIVAARLAQPQIYSQLMRVASGGVTGDTASDTPLFEQLWQDSSVQQTLIQALSASHHIDADTTAQLLLNAAPLLYRELNILADGQFLPAFLQAEQPALRAYLPIWSKSIITATQNHGSVTDMDNMENMANIDSMAQGNRAVMPTNAPKPQHTTVDSSAATAPISTATAAATLDMADTDSTDALHASRANHTDSAVPHTAHDDSMKRAAVRTRNQRRDLMVRLLLLVGAVIAIGLVVWALFLKPSNDLPVEPVVAAPVAVAPEPVEQVLSPVELSVGVDDSGNLYSCSATVGDDALQSTLQDALNTSFGEQASICTLTVQTTTATSIDNLADGRLSDVFTMLRSTPFARLHLQNNRLTLEAPNSESLQRLVTEIGALVPAMPIDSTAPLPLPDDGSNRIIEDQFENDNVTINDQYDSEYDVESNNNTILENDISDSGFDDDLDNGFDEPPTNNRPTMNAPSDIPNNTRADRRNNTSNSSRTRPPGPFSESEVDEMASSIIVAEPAQVR